MIYHTYIIYKGTDDNDNGKQKGEKNKGGINIYFLVMVCMQALFSLLRCWTSLGVKLAAWRIFGERMSVPKGNGGKKSLEKRISSSTLLFLLN